MLTIGKLYGVMHATAPIGWRRAIAPIRPPGASAVPGISCGGSGITVGSSARREYVSKRVHAVGTCICLPTVSVQPVSAITVGQQILVVALDRVAGLRQQLGAVLGRGLRPLGERLLRGAGRVERLGGRGLGRDADDLFGGGVDDVVAAVGSVDPLAADQQLSVRHERRSVTRSIFSGPARRVGDAASVADCRRSAGQRRTPSPSALAAVFSAGRLGDASRDRPCVFARLDLGARAWSTPVERSSSIFVDRRRGRPSGGFSARELVDLVAEHRDELRRRRPS